MISFGSRGLGSMAPQEAATMMALWVRGVTPGSIQECVLQRGAEHVTLYVLGKGAGAAFTERFFAATGKVEALVELMMWCKANHLKLEKEYVACHILSLRPPEGRARADLGLPALWAPPAPSAEVLRPDATPQERDPAVERAVQKIAAEVVDKFPVVGEVIAEMRRRTEGFRYSQPPVAPVRFTRGSSFIGDPLTFRPEDLAPQAREELSAWWSSLGREDRREFARFFGLWCAHARHQAAPK